MNITTWLSKEALFLEFSFLILGLAIAGLITGEQFLIAYAIGICIAWATELTSRKKGERLSLFVNPESFGGFYFIVTLAMALFGLITWGNFFFAWSVGAVIYAIAALIADRTAAKAAAAKSTSEEAAPEKTK